MDQSEQFLFACLQAIEVSHNVELKKQLGDLLDNAVRKEKRRGGERREEKRREEKRREEKRREEKRRR